MGSAVAKRLVSAGCTVYTNLDGRSDAAHQRARDAGMIPVPLPTLVASAHWILSIVPPSEAYAFAEKIRGLVDACAPGPRVFVDCNAVNPDAARRIGALFAGSAVRFVDAGIVGGPPRPGYDPTFYACSDEEGVLEEFAAFAQYGLRVSLLQGPGAGVGDASALKLCESVSHGGSSTRGAHGTTPVDADDEEGRYRALHDDDTE